MQQPTYELVVLLHPDLEIDVEAPINWGKKRLAYRIKKQDFAIYVYFELELEGAKVRELENQILITEEILRHILVVHEVNPAAPAKKEVKNGQEL
jgi:ribosomal protein S6